MSMSCLVCYVLKSLIKHVSFVIFPFKRSNIYAMFVFLKTNSCLQITLENIDIIIGMPSFMQCILFWLRFLFRINITDKCGRQYDQ